MKQAARTCSTGSSTPATPCVVIEHNLDVIKCADWVIDLGPEGGDEGGRIVAEGTPEEVARVKESYTGQHLAKVLAAHRSRKVKSATAASRVERVGA